MLPLEGGYTGVSVVKQTASIVNRFSVKNLVE